MKQIENWYARAAAKLNRAKYLEDAILDNRYFAYSAYRLRFFFGISLVEAAIHIIEFTILSFIFSQQTLILALILRSFSGLIIAWWWGALESMRERIRDLHREGKAYRVGSIIARWMLLSRVIAAVIMIVTIAAIIFDISRPTRQFDIIHLFAFAIGLQVSLSILTRTYHSIVYAIRRVYRPFLAITSVQLTAFLGTLLIWPLFALWSFPLMLILTALLSAGLTVYYVRRMYRFLNLPAISEHPVQRPWRTIRLVLAPKTILAGLAYASIRLDNIIVILLFVSANRGPVDYNMFLFFYLISPFIHSTYSWAQLFYFDLKRLEMDLLTEMKYRFGRFVRRVSWFIGLTFFVIASLVGTLLIQKNLGILYLLFALFFLFRAQIAFFQIRAFSDHRYGVLLLIGAVIIGAVLFAQNMISGMSERFGFYVFALLSTLLLLIPGSLFRFSKSSGQKMLSLPEWINRLRGIKSPVRIRAIKIDSEGGDYQVSSIAARLLGGTAKQTAATRIGKGRIVWFEHQALKKSPSEQTLFTCGSGMLNSVKSIPYADSGEEALLAAQQGGLLGSSISNLAIASDRHFDINEITDSFREKFPGGFCFNTRTHRADGPRPLTSEQRREVFYSAIRYSKSPFQRMEPRHFDVSTLLVGNEIRMIFAIPANVASKSRRLWKSFTNEFNVMCASGARVNERGNRYMLFDKLRQWLVWSLITMGVIAAGMTPMEDRIVGTFIMKPTDRAEVRAPMASFLTAVNADEGDNVAAGNLISEMEVPGLESDISQVEAEIAEIRAKLRILGAAEKGSDTARSGKLREYKAELEFARKNYKKARVLLKKGAIDDQQFRLLEKDYHVWDSQYQQLLAEQDAERAHLSRSQERMRYLEGVAASLRLKAPIDGTIVTSNLSGSVGRYFEEGDIIFEVVNPKRLEAELSIPEQDMINVQAGQRVELKIFALPYQTINTSVTRIAPTVTTGVQDQNTIQATPSEGVRVYSRLEQVIPELVPGMTGYARITLKEQYAAAVLAKRLMRFIRTEFWW